VTRVLQFTAQIIEKKTTTTKTQQMARDHFTSALQETEIIEKKTTTTKKQQMTRDHWTQQN